MRQLLLFLSLCLPLFAAAQLNIPPSSAPATLQTQLGLTNFTITYHRPSVKGRLIFGELLPYGEIWRTGANEATQISFDQPILIADQRVEPGSYSIYTIPQENENWTFILNADLSLWDTRGYDESKDVLRIQLPVKDLAERVETLEFRWMDISHQQAKLCLEWENIRLSVPVNLLTDEQVKASLTANLTEGKATGNDYYRAARYYLDNDLDLQQAKSWMDKRIEMDGEQFGIMRYQAFIEYELGNYEAARRIMERSLELAEAAPNPHYVKMNTQTLKAWQKTPVATLKGEEVLAKSINYHDPERRWWTDRFELKLYESRPGGGYRISNVHLAEAAGHFGLQQQRGKDQIFRAFSPAGCQQLLNGKPASAYNAEEVKQHRLSCEAGQVYRDYYTYLWGLPMKLEDAGTIIDPAVYRVDFFGQELLEVKVTYDEAVGGDIWYFYFHPDTYALSGYRFYHDEAANDGEYILLEKEAEVNGVKFPAIRHWYTHGDRRYLGSDEIIQN